MGWSQRAVAGRMGLSQSTLCLLETGKLLPSAATLSRLSEVLGVPMQVLWEGPLDG